MMLCDALNFYISFYLKNEGTASGEMWRFECRVFCYGGKLNSPQRKNDQSVHKCLLCTERERVSNTNSQNTAS